MGSNITAAIIKMIEESEGLLASAHKSRMTKHRLNDYPYIFHDSFFPDP